MKATNKEIIGYTNSKKPIYYFSISIIEKLDKVYKKFNAEDHLEAVNIHKDFFEKLKIEADNHKIPGFYSPTSNRFKLKSDQHLSLMDFHKKRYEDLSGNIEFRRGVIINHEYNHIHFITKIKVIKIEVNPDFPVNSINEYNIYIDSNEKNIKFLGIEAFIEGVNNYSK